MHTVDVSLELPASVTAGTYKLGLWIPDGSDRLRYNPRYAIPLVPMGIRTGGFLRMESMAMNVLTAVEVE